jgi:hypothetical protein
MARGNWIYLVLGLFTAALGTIPVLSASGILPSRPPAPGDAPVWLAYAIGLMFFMAGMLAVVKSIAGGDPTSYDDPASPAMRVFYQLAGAGIAILLAVVLSWVAFGPGDRPFSMGAGSGGAAIITGAAGGGEIIGRAAFGIVAALAWTMIGGTVLVKARRWLQQHCQDASAFANPAFQRVCSGSHVYGLSAAIF